MGKGIRSQFHFAINNCFTEGTDKHSYKEQNGQDMGANLFSYTSKFNALDIAKNFSNFLKEEFKEVRMVKDITSDHIQAFLNNKAETCQDTTLQTYSQVLNKLELAIERTYNIDVAWKGEYVTPLSIKEQEMINSHRGVDSVITRADFNTLIQHAKDNPCQGADAVRMQDILGIRVSEIATIRLDNIDLEKGTILLDNCKGGRDLVRELSPQDVATVKEIIDRNYHPSNLFSIKDSAINSWVRDAQDRIGVDRHSVHDMRRCIAQEKYDQLREEGYSKKDALSETSIFLNHGGDREALLRECYIKIH